MEDNKSFLKYLGTDREEEIKDAIRDILIGNIEEDLKSQYFVDPDTVIEAGNAMITEVLEEVRAIVKEEVKAKIYEKMKKEVFEKAGLAWEA